jgi:hypothetical protein
MSPGPKGYAPIKRNDLKIPLTERHGKIGLTEYLLQVGLG